MATPPFDLDTGNPADNAAETNFPANERAFRDAAASYLNWEHDDQSGHHKLMELDTAGRDAITDWVAGSLVMNTDVVPNQYTLQEYNGTTWASIGPLVSQPRWSLITSSGTFAVQAPTILVTLVGGGGGGGGGTIDAANPTGGGGGGAGALVYYLLSDMTVGDTLTIAIGGAGAFGVGGSPGTTGANGGDTTLSSGTATIISATAGGGIGGLASLIGPNAGGNPGTPVGGTGQVILLTGAFGSAGFNVSPTFGTPGLQGTISHRLGGFGYGGNGGYATTAVGNNGANGIQGCCFVEWIEL